MPIFPDDILELFSEAPFVESHNHETEKPVMSADGLEATFGRPRETWRRIDTPVGATGTSGFCYLEKCVKCVERADGLYGQDRVRLVKKMPKHGTRLKDNRKSGKSLNDFWRKNIDRSLLPDKIAREINAVMLFSLWFPLRFVKGNCWWHDDHHFFIAMEYLKDGDLSCQIPTLVSLDVESREKIVSRIMIQVVFALRYLHDANFAHRDIKPKNILVHSITQSKWSVRVADFGLTKRIQEVKEEPHYRRGTIPYMAPEILPIDPGVQPSPSMGRTNQDVRPADMWALGITTFELLTGCRIFSDNEEGLKDIQDPSRRQQALNAAFEKLEQFFSTECLEFIRELLESEVRDRLEAEIAIDHSWFGNVQEGEVVPSPEYLQEQFNFTTTLIENMLGNM